MGAPWLSKAWEIGTIHDQWISAIIVWGKTLDNKNSWRNLNFLTRRDIADVATGMMLDDSISARINGIVGKPLDTIAIQKRMHTIHIHH